MNNQLLKNLEEQLTIRAESMDRSHCPKVSLPDTVFKHAPKPVKTVSSCMDFQKNDQDVIEPSNAVTDAMADSFQRLYGYRA